jgi:hypothetical membrane protein
MSKTRRVAALWFLGGVALLLAGVLGEPRRPFSIIAGVLFFVVGSLRLRRDRGGS